MSYFNNGNNALKASMNNHKTMCWKQSGHMDIHFIYYAYTHTQHDQKFVLYTATLLFCWQNQAAELE